MKKRNIVSVLSLLLVGANLFMPINVNAAEPNMVETDNVNDASGVHEVPTPPLPDWAMEQYLKDQERMAAEREQTLADMAQGQAEWEAMYGKHDEPAQPTENAAPAESAPAPAPATSNVSQPAETTTSAPAAQAPSNGASKVAESKDVKKQTKSDADEKDKENKKSTKEKATEDSVKKDSKKTSNGDKATPAYKYDPTDPSSVVDEAEIPTDPRMDDSKKGGIVVAVFEKVGDAWKCVAAGVRDACSNAIDWFFGLWS